MDTKSISNIKNFCTNVKFICRERDISFYEICKTEKISNSYISKIKTDNANLTLEKITVIADYFKLPYFVFCLPPLVFRYIVIVHNSCRFLPLSKAINIAHDYLSLEKDKKGKRSESVRQRKKDY